MKALILNGASASDQLSAVFQAAMQSRLAAAGYSTQTIVLREQKIGNCAGCFNCWVRTPGVCNTNDANRSIAAAIIESDLLIYLTPVLYGGYSAPLKQLVDHQIQNISPFFTAIQGETHHHKRYQHYPNMLVLGWAPDANPHAEAIFGNLVERNALNMYAQTHVWGVIHGEPDAAMLTQRIDSLLHDVLQGRSTPTPPLPNSVPAMQPDHPIKRAVLLVGSPRTTKSTSYALGSYLVEQLASHAVETESIQIYTSFNNPERRARALERIATADLIVLAFPVYVDSPPAVVCAALEQLGSYLQSHPSTATLAVLVNCGYPEAQHTATSIAIAAEFARRSGLAWAGALALGGGEGMVHGTPLSQLGGRASHLRQALEQSAAALVHQQPIPASASAMLAKSIIPAWVYRFLAGMSWIQRAHQHGVAHQLRWRPYASR